jgi:hypothetical protein
MIKVFIGYDPREAVVFHVCAQSIIRHTRRPVSLVPLALNMLTSYSERHSDGSNQFIYSRFLTPFLCGYTGWALFIDGDMLLRTDLGELWDLRDESKAVMCVHHDYKTKTQDKYMGAKNADYPRKNWSSVVLWNCGHPANRDLTPQFIEHATGAQLHRFTWLPDDLIGEIPKVWNWLPDEFGSDANAKLLHWTLGAPSFHEYADVPMSEEWHRERMYMDYCIQRQL